VYAKLRQLGRVGNVVLDDLWIIASSPGGGFEVDGGKK
jgi:hypothetical protein